MKKTKFTALLVSMCMLMTQMAGIVPVFASSMSFNNGTVSIDWEGESTNATLITAEYDVNGVLSQLKTYDENLNTGTNNIGTDYLNAGTKVMLWDSTSNMIPLMNAYCVSGGEITSLSVDDTYQLSENNGVSTMSANTLSVSYSTSETTGTGVITIDTPAEYTDSQKTLMVLKPGTDKTNISAADIIAIDQGEDLSRIAISALDETTDTGVYTVLMGGTSGDIYMGTFSIGDASILCGDLDKDCEISIYDAQQIAKYDVGSVDLSEEDLLAADCDFDGKVNSRDVLEILKYNLGYVSEYVGTCITGSEEHNVDTETNTADMSVKLVQNMNSSVGRHIVFDIAYSCDSSYLQSLSAYIPINKEYVESVDIKYYSDFSSGLSYGGYDAAKEQISLSFANMNGICGTYDDGKYKIAAVILNLTDAWDGGEINLSDFIVTTNDDHKMSMKNAVAAEGLTPVIQDEISGSYTDMGYDGIENEIKWKCASDGVLTIGGTGIIKQSPWINLDVKSIVIEEGITQFYADTFSSFKNLESITIPTSLIRVSSLNTLSGKVNFKVDKFNNNFSSFDGALYDKNKLKIWLYAKDKINPDYALPDGITIVDASAFADGSSLRSIILPNTLGNIRSNTFNNCSALETVYIGKNITEIGSNAFDGCDSLSTVYYNGTEDEWNSIVIESGNDNLINAKIVYNQSVVYYNLNNNDETLVNQMFTSGGEVTITSEIPVRDGYTFLGWSTNPDDLQAMYQTGETTTPSGNLVLYAVWSSDEYEIEFVTNDGGDSIIVRQGYETEIKYPLISRAGYRFDGWYKDEALTQKADTIIMPDENLTFYAKWAAIAENDMSILWSCGFEETENCNSEENGDNYAVMPSLVNGDNGQQSYDDIDGISLNTSTRYGDDSSYFKLDSENVGDIENSYLTTAICRFSNLGRGNTIRFNGDTGYSPSEDNNLVFVFDVKMQDSEDPEIIYDTNFSIGKTIVTRDRLGAENDEWTKVMVIYSLDEGMRLYKISGGTAELIAEDANNTALTEMAFNAHTVSAIKSNSHPYGYPLVSLDAMYIYTVSEENFSLETLNELQEFKGRLKKAVNLQWNGTTAQWDSVPHASSYNVSLLRNRTVIKTVNGVEGTSYDFGADLKNGCVYRFKVAAVSADSDYNDGRDAVSGTYSSTDISVGDYVQMGTYYDEPILWRCIDVDENGPLLVTDKILCVKEYDAPGNVTTGSHTVNSDYSYYWGDSNLRCWLNSDAEAGKVVWTCGNPPSSKALNYDAYDGEAGFLSNFSATEKYVINPVSRNKGEFTDKVTLLDIDEVNIFNFNNDMLGTDYKIGILSNKAVENSEYLKTISRDFDEETQTEIKYKGGDKYNTYLMPYDENGVGVMTSNGYTVSGGSYCGVRPAIHIKDGFELTGEGTETEPYSIVDDIAAKVSLPENDVTPKIYDIIKIPVSVSENTGFASAAVSLSYDTDRYTFISVTPSSSLLGATITKSETNDGVNILAVNPSNITGDGTIFTVNLMVNVDALNTTSEITVKPVEFYDENQKLLVIDTGNAKMQSILSVSGDIDGNTKVNSADAVLLSQYLAKYQSASLTDTQKNNADVYTDNDVNVKDMYVLSQYIVNNLTSTSSAMSLFAADNPKLSASASYADNDSSMIDVTFSVKDNSGFTSFLFEMGFDKARLTPVSITVEDVLKNESITSNINETGVDLSSLDVVTALLNKSEGTIETDGKLYTVRFKINGELADSDAITFTNSGFISKVDDIQLDAPTAINLKEALNTVDEPQNEVSNLKADAGDGHVTLTWDENDNALAYVVYQDGKPPQTVFDTTYIVTGLNNGTQYTFTVKILNNNGRLSDGVSVTAVPSLAIPPSDDNVHITYNNGNVNILSDYGLNNVVVIFAEYDANDLLVSVESKPVTVAAGTPTNYSKDKTVGDGNKVKVMLWNSMEEMQPLHSVVE